MNVSSGYVIRPDQRVSDSEKLTADWYINNGNYWVSTAISINDKSITKSNINASNGIVDDSVYEYALHSIQGDKSRGGSTLKNIPNEIRNIDFITPIREKNIGEYLQLPHRFTVKVDDPDITFIRDVEVSQKIIPLIQQLVINKMNENGEDTQVPSKIIKDIEKEIKDLKESWIDSRAINAQGLVEWVNDNNDIDNKRLTLYNYWWATEECYIYVYIQNDEVFYEVIRPTQGYPVSNGFDFVQDQEAFVIWRTITFERIEEYYKDKLSKEDRIYLKSLSDNISSGGSINVSHSLIYEIYGRKIFEPNSSDYNGDNNKSFSSSRYVNERIIFFKTQSQRNILTKLNQLEQIVTEVVDDDVEFDKSLGHIKLEKEWIIETWKQVIIGDLDVGIYLKPEPIEVQIYDKKGHCLLPIIGKKGIIDGVYINPIPKRIIGNVALANIITLKIERELAKYKAFVEILPKSLLEGDAGDVKGNYIYQTLTNQYIYDDSEIDTNTITQGYRLIGNSSVYEYIRSLIDFRKELKEEAWDMAHMNDSRYGLAPASSTVTNNNQNIINARLGSMLSISVFNNILLKLYEVLLEYSKVAYIDGKSGTIIDKDSGEVNYFNIDSDKLTASRYGLFMSNSVIDFNKLQQYKDFAFAAAQNGEMDVALEAIDSNNISKIRKRVKEFIKLEKEYKQRLEQEKIDAQNKQSDVMLKIEQNKLDNKIEQIGIKEDLQKDRELAVEAAKENNKLNK